MEDKTTARPWRLFDENSLEIVGPDGHTLAEVYQCGGIREIGEAEANTAHIVRCVNAHDALVEAAKLAVTVLSDPEATEWARSHAIASLNAAAALKAAQTEEATCAPRT